MQKYTQNTNSMYKIQNKSTSINVSIHSFNKYNYKENVYAQNTNIYKNTSLMQTLQSTSRQNKSRQ